MSGVGLPLTAFSLHIFASLHAIRGVAPATKTAIVTNAQIEPRFNSRLLETIMESNYLSRDTYGMYKNSGPGPGPALMGADTLIGNDVYNTGEESLATIEDS